MFDPNAPLSRMAFLRLATYFEGSLVILAYIVGWLGDIGPFDLLTLNLNMLLFGVVGTVPLYAMFLVSYRLPVGELRVIRRLLIDKMGPLLSSCRWQDMAYLGLLAGVTEELLFRGVLQPLIESTWGWAVGLIASNLLFAMAHAITPLYAVLAGLTGVYLGLAVDFGGERNLGIPMLIHGLYDFLAFLAVTKTYRDERSQPF